MFDTRESILAFEQFTWDMISVASEDGYEMAMQLSAYDDSEESLMEYNAIMNDIAHRHDVYEMASHSVARFLRL